MTRYGDLHFLESGDNIINIRGAHDPKVDLHPVEAANIAGSSLPDYDVLGEYVDISIWKAAFDAASYGDGVKFNMGAIIFRDNEIISAGTSQRFSAERFFSFGCASLHAERHALLSAYDRNLEGASCVVVGYNRSRTGSPWSSCPCASCAVAMAERGIADVYYPQRCNDGSWTVKHENVDNLVSRVQRLEVDKIEKSPKGFFARQGRLCVV